MDIASLQAFYQTLYAGLQTHCAWLFAALLVFIYAGNRFNTPKTARSETGRMQYHLSCGFYIVCCTLLFVLLAQLIRQDPASSLSFLLFGATEKLGPEIMRLSAPFIAALLMTTFLTSVPFVRVIDAWLLERFHHLGSIPLAAVRLAQRIRDVVGDISFALPQQLLSHTSNYIEDSAELPSAMKAELRPDPSADSARYRFTRNLSLYVIAQKLKGRARFAADYPNEVGEFEKRIASFLAQSVAFFALADQLDKHQLEPLLEPIIDARRRYKAQCAETYEEITIMLARMLLYGSTREHAIVQELTAFGLPVSRPKIPRIPSDYIALDALLVMLLFVGSAMISAKTIPIKNALIIASLVAITHSLAAVFAILPKHYFCWARPAAMQIAGERPWLAYLVSALATFIVSGLIALGYYILRQRFAPDAVTRHLTFAAQLPWQLLPAALSFGLAFACDDKPASDNDNWMFWCAEAIGLAILMFASGIFVLYWIVQQLPPEHSHWSFVIFCIMRALIGAVFGSTIPHWYRASLRADQWASRTLTTGLNLETGASPAASP